MKNLAGQPDATAAFRLELLAADLGAVHATEPDRETRATVDGWDELPGGFTLRVTRRWCHAAARITPPLPLDAAVEINERPVRVAGTHYSGTRGRLGDVARAYGYAGGLDAAGLRDYARRCGNLDLWHVDTVTGLRLLVGELRRVVAARGLDAGAARAEHLRLKTEAWLAEIPPWLASDSALAEIALRSLHTDPHLDARDPRVAALRAAHPWVAP